MVETPDIHYYGSAVGLWSSNLRRGYQQPTLRQRNSSHLERFVTGGACITFKTSADGAAAAGDGAAAAAAGDRAAAAAASVSSSRAGSAAVLSAAASAALA